MSDRPIQLTENELKTLMGSAVEETFTKLGIDTTNPIEMQKDFVHLREWREATSAIQKKGLLTIIVILTTGACGALFLGIKHMLTSS